MQTFSKGGWMPLFILTWIFGSLRRFNVDGYHNPRVELKPLRGRFWRSVLWDMRYYFCKMLQKSSIFTQFSCKMSKNMHKNSGFFVFLSKNFIAHKPFIIKFTPYCGIKLSLFRYCFRWKVPILPNKSELSWCERLMLNRRRKWYFLQFLIFCRYYRCFLLWTGRLVFKK